MGALVNDVVPFPLLRRRRLLRFEAESESASDGLPVVAHAVSGAPEGTPEAADALSGSASMRRLPLRTQVGIAWGYNERRDRDMTTIPAQVTLDGNAVPRATRAQRIALSILQGEHLYALAVGENGFECDLSTESCLLCGGYFPKMGEVRYSTVFHGPLHVGCVVDAPNWAHPLTPFRRCADWRCSGGWTTEIDPSYSSLDRVGEGSMMLVRCPNHDGAA